MSQRSFKNYHIFYILKKAKNKELQHIIKKKKLKRLLSNILKYNIIPSLFKFR